MCVCVCVGVCVCVCVCTCMCGSISIQVIFSAIKDKDAANQGRLIHSPIPGCMYHSPSRHCGFDLLLGNSVFSKSSPVTEALMPYMYIALYISARDMLYI